MRHLRLLMTFMSVLVLNASYAWYVDGLSYSVTDSENKTVSLVGWNPSYFSDISDPIDPNVGNVDPDALGPTKLEIPWRVMYNDDWYTVTSIGEDAFSGCLSMTEVKIPNSIQEIGNNAFEDCSNLASVKVQWLTPLHIDESVFDGVDYETCRLNVLQGYKAAYQAADVWKNFKNIGEYSDDQDILMVFEDPQVKAICVKNWDANDDGEVSYREVYNVKDISGIFTGNTEITAFTELRSFNSLTLIPESAFEGCTKLEKLTIPPKVVTIGANAFKDCESLSVLTNASTALTTIGSHAFDGCAITTFTISAKITSIGEGAFANCKSLTKYSINGNNKYYTFSGSSYSNSRFILSKDKGVVVSYAAGASGACTIPTTVSEILPYAAAGSKMTSLTLNKVQAIGRCAFKGCASLASVTIPEDVRYINEEAFADCEKLYTLIIPTTVNSIGDRAFAGVAKGIRVQVSDETPKEITDGTFSSFTQVADGEITGRLFVPVGTIDVYSAAPGWKWFNFLREGTIADYADQIINFKDETTEAICVQHFDTDHDGYVTYTEAAAVTTIGTYFKGAQIGSFNELQYFTAVKHIEDDAFNGSTLSAITFPNGLLSIGSHAFANCNSLKTITVPATVTEIGDAPFASCELLTAIKVEEGNTQFVGSTSGSLFSYDHARLIQFPANATVTSVAVSDGIVSILPEAFSGAKKLTSVTIYNSVMEIGEKAFAGCEKLANVKVYWANPLEVPADIFQGVDVAKAKLNVPTGTTELYEAADVWKDFGTKVEFSDGYTFITFADPKVEAICLVWDTNKDGKLSQNEAKAVTSLGGKFKGNAEITSFNELRYFTGITEIAANEFKGCTALTTITFPTGITAIGESAFEGCSVLATAVLPTALVTIGKKAFYRTALKSVAIQKNLASIGEGAFGSVPSISKITVASTNPNFIAYSNAIFSKDTTVLITYPAYKAINTTIPAKVKTIYGYAFSGCDKVTGVNFSNVETIGEYAFENCTSISSISLGEKVTSVGQYAFTGCSNLESIIIPNTVTSIAAGAFTGMPVGVRCQVSWPSPLAITAGTFSNAVAPEAGKAKGLLFVPEGTSAAYKAATGWDFFTLVHEGTINDYAATLIEFEDKNVERLAVAAWDTDGDNKLSYNEAAVVTALGNVFTGQAITTFDELQYFTSLTEIGNNAFKNTGMTAVTIPANSTRFGNSAFQGTALSNSTFKSLTTLTTEIGDSAFAYTSFTSMSISERITKIGVGAFKGCSKMTQITVVADNPNYSAKNGVLYDKSGTRLMQFPARSTVNKKLITEFVIGDAVTKIDEDAFLLAANLAAVTIPETVTSIGQNAFRACTKLDSVTVGWHTPLAVPANTFEGVDVANAKLCVPKGTVAAYKAAPVWKNFGLMSEFLDDTSVIDFADAKVKAICVKNWDTNGDGELIVAEAKAAKTTLEGLFESNTEITSFEELKYFTGITTIAENAFQGCTALTAIELPSSVTKIEQGAFSSCTSLKKIELPAKVATLGVGVFANSTSLESIEVDADNTKYTSVNGVLLNKAKNTLVAYPAGREGKYEMPSTVKTISDYAFTGAGKLTGLKMSKNVVSIGTGAFRHSSLPYVFLPGTVSSISRWAFNDCPNLKVVKIGKRDESLGLLSVYQTVFLDMDLTQMSLYVPAGTLDSYNEMDVWKEFGTAKEYPNCDVNGDGYADMVDAVDIVKFVVDTPADVFDQYLADFDEDDDVTVADAVVLVNMIAEDRAAVIINYAPVQMEVDEELILTKDVNNTLSLSLNSLMPYTAFQFDLTLPEGSDINMAKLSARMKGHQMMYHQIGEHTWRFVALSLANKQFAEHEGALLHIQAGNPDTDEVAVSNIRFITTDGNTHLFDTVSSATPTDIVEMATSGAREDGVYYDLSGVRVSSPGKGLYILNGKKVIIK